MGELCPEIVSLMMSCCILVIRFGEFNLGFLVDEVFEVYLLTTFGFLGIVLLLWTIYSCFGLLPAELFGLLLSFKLSVRGFAADLPKLLEYLND